MNYRNKAKGCRFLGGKGKCGEIARIINSFRPESYLEPFVGSAKVMQSVRCPIRIGTDADVYVIDMLAATQEGYDWPDRLSEEEWEYWRGQWKGGAVNPMIGFAGYGCSFAGRFFQGYARDGKTNFASNTKKGLDRQAPYLKGVTFDVVDYKTWNPDGGTVVYCDPPYTNTVSVGAFKKPFDSNAFWAWAADRARNCTVLVSEYTCPVPDARVVWESSVAAGLRFGTGGDGGHKGSGKRKTEKLFLLGTFAEVGLGLRLAN